MISTWRNINIRNLPHEKWLPIAGFDGLYEVSDMGRVKSRVGYFKSSKVRILKQGLDADLYPQVILMKDKKRYCKKVGRLVGLHFVENPFNKPQINHKKGIRTDSRASELEWTTCKENVQHSYDILGRVGNPANKGRFGKLNWNSKPINQIDTESGKVLNSFHGASEAARILGINRRTLCGAALGNPKTYKGYKWEYATQVINAIKELI